VLLTQVFDQEFVGGFVECVAQVVDQQLEHVSVGEDGVLGQAALDRQVLLEEGLKQGGHRGGHEGSPWPPGGRWPPPLALAHIERLSIRVLVF